MSDRFFSRVFTFFFFSSRRRHTRCLSDWSSDVCSSDLITIDPVTRIEGHAKIDIYLDDRGQVADTQFHVTQVRGFEKFTEGRPFYEMPSITARICGICPVSHLLASAKAC